MKLLGYANAFRIKQTCADKPGGAHLGQVAIYAGESVDPMEIQERESPTHMGEPAVLVPLNPTPEMIAAGRQARQAGFSEIAIWDAMVRASKPTTPENPMAEPVYEPEILTPALAAQWVSEEGPGITADMAMDDLIHGRTVVIRKWTEAQAREAFEAWFFAHKDSTPTRHECWLAALRLAGKIEDKQS